MKHVFKSSKYTNDDTVTYEMLRDRLVEFRKDYGLNASENRLLEQDQLHRLVVILENRTRKQSWIVFAVLGFPVLLRFLPFEIAEYAILAGLGFLVIGPLILYYINQHKASKKLLKLSEKLGGSNPLSEEGL